MTGLSDEGYRSSALTFANFAGGTRSRQPFPPFWGYRLAISSVCCSNCPRNQRFELGRYRIQNLKIAADPWPESIIVSFLT